MKKLLALALLLPSLVFASFIDGNKLYKELTDKNQIALWYIAGVVDTGDEVLFCIPANARLGQLGQLGDMVQKMLADEPGKRHLSADSLVIYTLGVAFPCKKKPAPGNTY